VLREVLPPTGLVLEVASGTGQHAIHFAGDLPAVTWQPTERDEDALASIEAWRGEAGLENLLPPLLLDVMQSSWPVAAADAIFCSNMIHIAPWQATEALLLGASRVLRPSGPLVLYGPFFRADVPPSKGNLAFDAQLREQDSAWGVRSLEDVERVANPLNLRLARVIDMPSNNSTVVFRRCD
jgi:SAM-dependent methyltransferase